VTDEGKRPESSLLHAGIAVTLVTLALAAAAGAVAVLDSDRALAAFGTGLGIAVLGDGGFASNSGFDIRYLDDLNDGLLRALGVTFVLVGTAWIATVAASRLRRVAESFTR
jgi:hypothetical protein